MTLAHAPVEMRLAGERPNGKAAETRMCVKGVQGVIVGRFDVDPWASRVLHSYQDGMLFACQRIFFKVVRDVIQTLRGRIYKGVRLLAFNGALYVVRVLATQSRAQITFRRQTILPRRPGRGGSRDGDTLAFGTRAAIMTPLAAHATSWWRSLGRHACVMCAQGYSIKIQVAANQSANTI